MQAISDRAALDVWDVGSRRHALDRNLLLLASADVGPLAQLEALDVQARDRLLLEARQHTFGDHFELVTECAQCGAELEIEASASDFLAAQPAEAHEVDIAVGADDWHVGFRLPTTMDLAAALDSGADVMVACLQTCLRNGVRVAAAELPNEVRQAVDDAIAAAAPAADIELMIECVECDDQHVMAFDIGVVLWQEVAAKAQHLMTEIVGLAHAFGWTEQTILELSPHRRRSYLEAVS